jgi:hypothetical protein
MEHYATSAYLRLVRAMDSSKVDAMGREAKHDTKLGYKTIPLWITFGTLEDKNAFKDAARSLELNCKDSFPKQYAKQKDRALDYFKNPFSLTIRASGRRLMCAWGIQRTPVHHNQD